MINHISNVNDTYKSDMKSINPEAMMKLRDDNSFYRFKDNG